MKKMKRACLILLSAILLLSVGCGKKANDKVEESMAPVKEVQKSESEVEASPSEEQITETLPLGTIVKLKGKDEKYMITTHKYMAKEVPDITWQYAACLYPVGNIDSKPAMAFNNDDIEEVIAKGLESMDVASQVVDEVKEGYLPIGTVVKVQGLDTPIMIFGRKLQGADGTKYDYTATDYPDGNADPNENYLFNKDIVEYIYFIGYSDEENEAFVKALEK